MLSVATAIEAVNKMDKLRGEGHSKILVKDLAGKIVDIEILLSRAEKGL